MKGGYGGHNNSVLNVLKTSILVEVEFLKKESNFKVTLFYVSLASCVSSSHGHIWPLFIFFLFFFYFVSAAMSAPLPGASCSSCG